MYLGLETTHIKFYHRAPIQKSPQKLCELILEYWPSIVCVCAWGGGGGGGGGGG